MTPHNQAQKGQIAPVVLMPGDPLRAKYIAEHYLNDIVLFNSVRNMLGYTGLFKGVPVSVMGSGMGMPSIGIYSYELFARYDVQAIIRIGTCGGYTGDLHIRDIVLAESAWSESTFALAQSGDTEPVQLPDASLQDVLRQSAGALGLTLKPVRLHSSDVFYHEDDKAQSQAMKQGCKAVEMESFALFHNAKVLNKKAACICTVSDSFVYDEEMSDTEREQQTDQMIRIALESAASLMQKGEF